MAEIYSFTARVVGGQKNRIRISAENPDSFMDYIERVGLPLEPLSGMKARASSGLATEK